MKLGLGIDINNTSNGGSGLTPTSILNNALVFEAPLTSTASLARGTGVESFTRAEMSGTGHVAGVAGYCPDYLGNLIAQPPNVRPCEGSRWTGTEWVSTLLDGSPIPSDTLKGYLSEPSAVNMLLQSNSLSTGWTSTLDVLTQNQVDPSGVANSAWTLTDNSATVSQQLQRNVTLTAVAHTLSAYFKKTTGTLTVFPAMYVYDPSVKIGGCTIDTTNGTATVWTAYTGYANVPCTVLVTSVGEFWRVSLTYTGTAAIWTHFIVPAARSTATSATGVNEVALQGSIVVAFAQVEATAFATSYIPTTTNAVTRAATSLTYNQNQAAPLSMYAEFTTPYVNASISQTLCALLGATANERIQLRVLTAVASNIVTGGASQSTVSVGSVTANTKTKAALVAQTNYSNTFKGGVAGTADTTCTMPTTTSICIGGGSIIAPSGVTNIKNVKIYSNALSDQQLIALTK